MPQHRQGVTLLEVVVVIAIVGLLAALLLPAVQQARANSQRMSCLNNFRQLGVALNSMAENRGEYSSGGNVPIPEQPYMAFFPYLEQTNLMKELQQGFSATIPPVLLCPSETRQNEHSTLRIVPNYYLNGGSTFRSYRPSSGFESIGREPSRKVSDITDGLSNTAAISERLTPWPMETRGLMTDAELDVEPRRTFWFTAVRYGGRGEELLAIAECTNNRTTAFPQFYGLGTLHQRHLRGYDHMLPPNSPACYNGPEDHHIDDEVFLIPATSNHSGGVNVLMLDGSAHFVSENVDGNVWRALGTRNGNETVPLPF